MRRFPWGRLFAAGFRAAFASRYRRFTAALADPGAAQERVRRRILRLVARTAYGVRYGITGHESMDEFRRRLPIVTYEDLAPWVERQARCHDRVLAAEAVRVFEKTSGSSGRHKLIPYTPSLLRSFDECFFVWAYDLIAHGPRFATGKVFFSVSPAFQEERATAAGVPISLDDDSGYLSPLMRRCFGRCFVVPPNIKRVRDPDAYRRVLADLLLATADLEVLSVWNPTYLTTLLAFIAAHRDLLRADLARGRVEVDGQSFGLAPLTPARAALLDAAAIEWVRLWPALKLVSCWTDAGAAYFARRLFRDFPGVLIQGKGLLATEAPITVPLLGAPAPVPLVSEVFLEFEDGTGDVSTLAQLVDGAEYEVIVTQAGGLTRYRMRDRIIVSGRYQGTPCLRFVGRTNDVSDLVGEKLNEVFAREALARVLGDAEAFAVLVPRRRESEASFYLCLTDSCPGGEDAFGEALETELARAFHYRQARLLGQLGPVRIERQPAVRDRYYDHFMRRGMKWGDIKYAALVPSL